MARTFAKIGFTSNVKTIQSKMGSRENYQTFEQGGVDEVVISESEKQFIEQRDSFYMATMNEDGWPYIQHRGGPKGFLKVIGNNKLGFADFSGNRQYLTVGNLLGNDRVCLFLMSYSERRRLKIWGRVKVIEEHVEPAQIALLEVSDFRAPVERGFVITIEALDWNCPKYITPRYTQDEVENLLAEYTKQNTKTTNAAAYAGRGNLPMVVSAIRQLTKEVRGYELKHANGEELPGYEAGAHINVPVQLNDGSYSTHAYSLVSMKQRRHCYQIAVKCETDGDGGSLSIHKRWQVGTKVNLEEPENYFRLHSDDRPTVIIAGGIGITPLKAMAEDLMARRAAFEIHYSAKTRSAMPFYEELSELFPENTRFYFSREKPSNKLDFTRVFNAAKRGALFYICGPESFIKTALFSAAEANIDRAFIHTENFN
ncbi:pyridoxamine 5'-phosphate oxidase family protein [Methylophaga thiooxydans]|uniref:pyridoxamine 5'-phosphate oxidase family protein n=1 Tax=Methylophaga thiooxydans TaxID=392484 RepID=UPI00235463C9|nr:pyridoxamine 5'-phosphate oxidase family protein [Methylophaga thiooxydans]